MTSGQVNPCGPHHWATCSGSVHCPEHALRRGRNDAGKLEDQFRAHWIEGSRAYRRTGDPGYDLWSGSWLKVTLHTNQIGL